MSGEEELILASYGQRGHDLLIETPSATILGLDRMLGELRTAGYRVTLAHPERSAELRQNESMVRALVEQGVLLQVNAESLLGPHRSAAHRSARELCLTGSRAAATVPAVRPGLRRAGADGPPAQRLQPAGRFVRTRALCAGITNGRARSDVPTPASGVSRPPAGAG